MDFDRRMTLGTLSQSAMNSRNSIGGKNAFEKPSGAMNVTSGNANTNERSRMSMGVSANRMLPMGQDMTNKRATINPPPPRKSILGQRSIVNTTMNSATVLRMADPRVINDKSFLNESIRSLMRYLTDHGYDHVISPKILSRPSNKDFSNIVLFLLKQVDVNFTVVGKFEDEIVAAFKHIGYPCQISKANITSAGTPHAWPSLLAALVWLVDLLQYDEASQANQALGMISDNSSNIEADDRVATQIAFYQYLSQSYSLFMMGEDDRASEMETKFINNFESRNLLIKDIIASCEQRNQMLNNEIEQVERRREYLPELESRKRDYNMELNKFQSLVDQYDKQKVQLIAKMNNRTVELEKILSATQIINEEINILKNKIEHQEISPEDVKRMNAQKEQLESSLANANELKRTQQDRMSELEISLRSKIEQFADEAHMYNSLAEDLKLAPHTARNARGRHLSIEIDVRAKKDLLKTDVHGTILPALLSVSREITETTATLNVDFITEKDALEEAKITESEEREALLAEEARFKKTEETFKREKEAMELAEKSLHEEVEELEDRLTKLEEKNKVDQEKLAHLERMVEELKHVEIQNEKNHVQKKNKLIEDILEMVTQCANYRESTQNKLRLLKESYAKRLEDCLLGKGSSSILNNAIAVSCETNPTISNSDVNASIINIIGEKSTPGGFKINEIQTSPRVMAAFVPGMSSRKVVSALRDLQSHQKTKKVC